MTSKDKDNDTFPLSLPTEVRHLFLVREGWLGG
jgi:hypothetical protein